MAWIESHQSLRKHPKVIRAARYLGIHKLTMIGHMHCLWWWALDYAQDGDLAPFADDDIAEAAEWEGDASKFVFALEEIAKVGDKPGLLERKDGKLLIHDWWDYAGKLIERRRIDAARKAASRAKAAAESAADNPRPDAGLSEDDPQSVQWTSNGHPKEVSLPAYVPYPTVPYPTIPCVKDDNGVVNLEDSCDVAQTVLPIVEKPKPRKPRQPKTPKPKSSVISDEQKTIMARYREVLGYPVPSEPRENKGAQMLAKGGYTADQVIDCYKDMKADQFWADKHVSLQSVNGKIGAWCIANNGHRAQPFAVEVY